MEQPKTFNPDTLPVRRKIQVLQQEILLLENTIFQLTTQCRVASHIGNTKGTAEKEKALEDLQKTYMAFKEELLKLRPEEQDKGA